MFEHALRERRGRKRLDRSQAVGADDQDLAGLDVADVGGADEIHRAGFRADDHGVAEPAEGQRPEAMRIAHRNHPVVGHHHERKRALHLRHRHRRRVLDAAAFDRA